MTGKLELKKRNERSEATRKAARIFRTLVAMAVTISICSVIVLADGGDTEATTAINNLKGIITGVVKAIGGILGIWGVVQVGLSFSQHDASQRAQGFLQLAGGIMIFFAPELFDAISGTT